MLAMRRFLIPRQRQFQTHDITLSHWSALNKIGTDWSAAKVTGGPPDLSLGAWTPHLPSLDVWLRVSPTELQHVSKLVPTLDWQGGLLGVRLRLEAEDPTELHKAFMQAMTDAEAINDASASAPLAAEPTEPQKLTLWPVDMMDFLSRRLRNHLVVRSYPLDPSKAAEPENSVAKPQVLPPTVPAIDGDPLAGLIRVNEINAQRGFGETQVGRDDEDALTSRSSNRLRSSCALTTESTSILPNILNPAIWMRFGRSKLPSRRSTCGSPKALRRHSAKWKASDTPASRIPSRG
jgi:hypothetical protein